MSQYGTLNISSINGSGLENNFVFNPEFTINQRGASSPTATSNAYNYDRWYYDGTYLYQGVENANLRNTTYCLSWSGTATASYSLNTASSSSQGSQTYTAITTGSTITISSLGSNTLWLRFNGTPSQVKLEIGSAPTTFIPRDYGRELILCQRYFEKSYLQSVVPGTSGQNLGGVQFAILTSWPSGYQIGPSVSFMVQKRTAPTILIYSYNGASNKLTVSGGTDQGTNSCQPNLIGDWSFTCSNQSGSSISVTASALFQFTASAEL